MSRKTDRLLGQLGVDVIEGLLDDGLRGPLVAAFEFEDLQAIALRLAQLLDLAAVAVLSAHGHDDGRDLHAAEAAQAVVEDAGAGALEDDAAEIVADAHEDRAGARAAGEAGADLAAGADPEALHGVLVRGEEVADARIPRAVLRLVEEDGDVAVLLHPVGHVAERGLAAGGGDEERGPFLGRVRMVALREDDAVVVDVGVFGIAAVMVAGDTGLDTFLDDEVGRGRPRRGDRIGGRRHEGAEGKEQGEGPAHDEGVGANPVEGKRGCGLEAASACFIALRRASSRRSSPRARSLPPAHRA